MKLVLINNLDKNKSEYQVTDVGDSVLFYHFENFILQENLSDGEYTYFLYDDEEKLVAQSLLQIGNYESEHSTYSKEENNYKQYKP